MCTIFRQFHTTDSVYSWVSRVCVRVHIISIRKEGSEEGKVFQTFFWAKPKVVLIVKNICSVEKNKLSKISEKFEKRTHSLCVRHSLVRLDRFRAIRMCICSVRILKFIHNINWMSPRCTLYERGACKVLAVFMFQLSNGHSNGVCCCNGAGVVLLSLPPIDEKLMY